MQKIHTLTLVTSRARRLSGALILLLTLLSQRPVQARLTAEPVLSGLLNLNEASVEQLCLLPGIGPRRAEAIIELRRRRRFSWVGQIQRIRGVGPKTFRRIRRYLRVSGATTLARPGAAAPAPPAAPGAAVDADIALAGVDPSAAVQSDRSSAVAAGSGPAAGSSVGAAVLQEDGASRLSAEHPVKLPLGVSRAVGGSRLGEQSPDSPLADQERKELPWSAMPASLGPVLRLPFPMP